MKEVPKKETDEVSGGLIVVSGVPLTTWPTRPFPTEPCTPTLNDPLGDGSKSTPK